MSYHNASLSYSIRRAVLAHGAPRYQRATDAQKTLLLDQIIELTGYERKYALRLLNHDPKGPLALCVLILFFSLEIDYTTLDPRQRN